MDETLAAAITGDRQAIGALYERSTPQLRRYIAARVPAIDAEDVLSEVWLRVLRRLPVYEERGHPFTSWLYRVAESTCIDYRRYQARRPTVPTQPTHTLTDGPEAHIAAWDAEPVVRLLLTTLTPNQRRIILLRYFDDLSIEQTMATMGLSQAGVKARQHRAEARMRRLVAK